VTRPLPVTVVSLDIDIGRDHIFVEVKTGCDIRPVPVTVVSLDIDIGCDHIFVEAKLDVT
jgi:hypothetical protein